MTTVPKNSQLPIQLDRDRRMLGRVNTELTNIKLFKLLI